MVNIADIDKNFKVETKIEKEGIKFYNSLSKPFKIYGVFFENGKFRRMPEETAKKVSEGVYRLHSHTAGGRVRFRTDSPYIAINVKMGAVSRMNHFPITGTGGFDVYINEGDGEIYHRTMVPPSNIEEGYESLVPFLKSGMRDVTINFPLYSEVTELYIGLDENALIEEPSPYREEKPIVYYGSSITQGGCASRPGNCYQAYISRRFNCDYINLGFSGNAHAEEEIINHIKNMDMSIFVYDYDHNARDAQFLKDTHEKMFKAIRKTHPDTPVIMMSAPKWVLFDEWEKRRNIIAETYKKAVQEGDKNVYFLDNKALMSLCENNGTVDNVHPNDFGFASMARALGDIIEKIWR